MAKQFKIGYLPLTKANWTNETLEAARREARAYLQSLPGVEVVGGDRMIDFEEKAPQFQVSDTHWAKTWLLHEDAPKVEKPAVIQNLHEKIRANMGFAHLGNEEEGNA